MAREVRKLSLKERRRRSFLIKASLVLFLCVVSLCGVAYVTRIPAVTVSRITVAGASAVPQEKIQEVADAALRGSYAFIVPKRMSFVVPESEIQKSILTTFPHIDSVRIAKPDMQTVQVSVTERAVHAVWCGDRCFGMDKNGFIFTESSGSTTVRTYRGSLEAGPLRATFLPGSFVELDSFLERVSTVSKRKIVEADVHDDGDVFCQFEGGGGIRFTRISQNDDLLNSIASIFASQRFSGPASFEYVDFRFDGNKALVK